MKENSSMPSQVERVDQPIVDQSLATVSHSDKSSSNVITESDIFSAQRKWALDVIETGALFLNAGDYVSYAHNMVETHYGYAEGAVLFKPMFAAKQPFRSKQVEAISFFIGGVVNEDLGFALRPWQHVRFATQTILLQGSTAIAMGQYFFLEFNAAEELQAEFTFGYFKSDSGAIKINVHHSSLPYTAP